MSDARTPLERKLDELIGPPLYYCKKCMRKVQVKCVEGQEPQINRPCGPMCNEDVIAPRKAVVHGEGGMNLKDKTKITCWQLAAALTGRCV